MPPDCINLVYKNYAGSVLLALLEQIPNAASSDADEHFDEIRTGYREKRDVGFTSDRPCQKRLACAWRPHHQNAFRDATTKLLKLLWLFKKLDNLLKFFLGFFNACDVLEGHPFLLIA